MLRIISAAELPERKYDPVDAAALTVAGEIISAVRERGEQALLEYAEQFDGVNDPSLLYRNREDLRAAWESLDDNTRDVLERSAERVKVFAEAQRAALSEIELAVPGGRGGHRVAAVSAAGCYAPGGRYPLPSTALMTAVTARAAGVGSVWVASPNPVPVTLAAAYTAGADGLLAAGGAQAIAALAFGVGPLPRCPVIVGPGNKFVTAAKAILSGEVGIDMLAGPSELVVLADSSASPAVIAADLLAQAEHDDDAFPVVVSADSALLEAVCAALETQLQTLPTAETARAALKNGFAVQVDSLDEGISVINRLCPEHLEICCDDADRVAEQCTDYGAIFIGQQSAEVFGDYCAGPNHVLPTGDAARVSGGLSVFNFLRVRTWLKLDGGDAVMTEDAVRLARLEGLEAHARAVEIRKKS